jgi:hypothetical protein
MTWSDTTTRHFLVGFAAALNDGTSMFGNYVFEITAVNYNYPRPSQTSFLEKVRDNLKDKDLKAVAIVSIYEFNSKTEAEFFYK